MTKCECGHDLSEHNNADNCFCGCKIFREKAISESEDLTEEFEKVLDRARNEALEEAAKVAEKASCERCWLEYGWDWDKQLKDGFMNYSEIAAEIRKLKEEM